MRVEDENVDRLPIAAGFDRGRAGIAGGRADHRDVLAAPGQDRIEHRPDQLQRQILEGEGRPMKELEEPEVLVELYQRGHRGMAEPAIGRGGELLQFAGREGVAGEQSDDVGGDLGIGQAGKTGNASGQPGHPIRHVEPAILRETGDQHLRKGAGRRRSARVAGAEITHHTGPVSVPGAYLRIAAFATRRPAENHSEHGVISGRRTTRRWSVARPHNIHRWRRAPRR